MLGQPNSSLDIKGVTLKRQKLNDKVIAHMWNALWKSLLRVVCFRYFINPNRSLLKCLKDPLVKAASE